MRLGFFFVLSAFIALDMTNIIFALDQDQIRQIQDVTSKARMSNLWIVDKLDCNEVVTVLNNESNNPFKNTYDLLQSNMNSIVKDLPKKTDEMLPFINQGFWIKNYKTWVDPWKVSLLFDKGCKEFILEDNGGYFIKSNTSIIDKSDISKVSQNKNQTKNEVKTMTTLKTWSDLYIFLPIVFLVIGIFIIWRARFASK